MNKQDISVFVKECFTAFYKASFESIEAATHKYKAVRSYAVDLWDVRTVDEIKRDRQAGVVVTDYMRWCREQWQQLRPLEFGEPLDDPDFLAFKNVRESVKVSAAFEIGMSPEVYKGPDQRTALEEYARHLWLSRSLEERKRDKQLSVIQYDYWVWVFEEFYKKADVKTC